MKSHEPEVKRTIGFHTLIASLNTKCNDTQNLEELLFAGIKILHVNMAFGTHTELNQLLHKIREASKKIDNYENPAAIALEIRGRVVRVGRLRNNCSFNLETGKTTILTADEAFWMCSMPDVVFVGNFAPYIELLNVGEHVFINEKEIILQILKTSGNNVTCCIVKGGRLSSYMEVVLPYHIYFDKLTRWEKEDCIYAIKNRVNFLIVPSVTAPEYYHALRKMLNHHKGGHIMLLCSLNFFVLQDFEKIANIVDHFDGTWIDDFHIAKDEFSLNEAVQFALEISRELQKPIVLKYDQSVFDKLDNKNLLQLPDCFLFANHQNTLFLETKQLLAELDQNYIAKRVNNMLPSLCKDAVDAIIETVRLGDQMVASKCIFCVTFTGDTAIKFSKLRPYCPVLAITTSRMTAKKLTLWKNIQPFLYCETANNKYPDSGNQLTNYGIEYMKKNGFLDVGDLIYCCYNISRSFDQEAPNTFHATYVTNDLITIK